MRVGIPPEPGHTRGGGVSPEAASGRASQLGAARVNAEGRQSGQLAPMQRRPVFRLPGAPLARRGGRPLRAGESARVLPLAVPVTLAAAVALAAAAASLVADPPSAETLVGAAALFAAAVVAEAFPLPLEGVSVGATSLASVFLVATAVLFGWESAVVVAFATMIAVEVIHRRPPLRIVYNTSLYICAALAAGAAAALVGDASLLALVVSAFAAATAFYVVDIVLLAAVIARTREQSFREIVRPFVGSTLSPFLIMASLTATLAIVWDRSPFAALVLVGPLLAIAFYQRWLHGALDRLRQFDRLKDELIAVLSHEIRTPLTAVYGSALTLQQRNVDATTRDALLGLISTESARLARLLDDLLWASRLDTGRENTLIMTTDATEIASDVVETARARLPERMQLDLLAPADLPPVAADPDKLRQILVNLVENAIKYSPDGGRVEVELRRAGRFAHVSVRDEGIGIPGYEQTRIFEKFHRLDPDMTRGVGGTGLGLYICKQLVERMNGRIWVSSSEGRGSTFTFELPLDRSHPPARG